MLFDRNTTPLEALERSLYALADQMSGTIGESGDGWSIQVFPRSANADSTSLAHRFRQEVVDQTLRLRIAQRTDPIRNLVFAVAFSHSQRQDPDTPAHGQPTPS